MFWQTCQNILWFCKHGQKGRNRMVKIVFFSLSRFRADLNSSLAQSAGECWPYTKGVYSAPCWGLGAEIFTNFCFFIHNFGYGYARKPFKGSKDADFGLVSEKNLSQKNGSMGWGPGSGKGGQKNAKTLPLVTFPPANAKPKTKKNFSMSTRRLAESVEGLNSSLAPAAGDLWPRKDEQIYWAVRSLKG